MAILIIGINYKTFTHLTILILKNRIWYTIFIDKIIKPQNEALLFYLPINC
jgi:hypothetical protein